MRRLVPAVRRFFERLPMSAWLAVLAVVVVIAAVTVVATRSEGSSTDAAATASPPTFASTTSTTSTTTTTTTTTTTVPPTTTAPPPPSTEPPPPPPTTAPPARRAAPSGNQSAPVGDARCIVFLDGKGGSGRPTTTDGDGVKVVSPNGNSAAWGGRQWLYFPSSAYAQARAVVQRAIDDEGCGEVNLHGFSNGASFAAKLLCRGETFGGRLVGVVVDDPVPDHSADSCAPARGVHRTLYWTGALAGIAQPGWNCAQQDWTCEGGETIGIDAYQAHLGVSRKQSPFQGHQSYGNAPELNAWR